MRTIIEPFKTRSKKIFFDMCLNIIAVALPIAMLQLIIYPKVAKIVGGDQYGLMLTIYSIWIMISNSLGNVLNNIKLLRFPEYQKLGEEGDLMILLRKWIVGSAIVVFFAIWFYCGSFSLIHLVLGTVISICILLKAYLEVGFRIKLNYFSILCNNALLCTGFFLGFYFFRITGLWEFIFLTGYSFSFVFCVVKTGLLKEPFNKTSLYKDVRNDAYSLVLATVITNLINYADKLVLYPLMGGTAVSIYYTATILGKITGMLTGPINSVVLSYITRWDKSKTGVFYIVLAVGLGVVTVGYFITLLIARPVINLLFPQWVEEVMEIIPLTTVTVMLTVLTSLLQPFVLKYCRIQWQIGISAIGSITYFSLALLLWSLYGLKGFCVGTIIGVITKLLLILLVYYRSVHIRREEVNRQ